MGQDAIEEANNGEPKKLYNAQINIREYFNSNRDNQSLFYAMIY